MPGYCQNLIQNARDRCATVRQEGRRGASPHEPPAERNKPNTPARRELHLGGSGQTPTGIAPPLQSGAAAWRSCKVRLHLRLFPFSGAPGSCPGELLRAHPPPGKKAAAARRTQQSALWLGAPAVDPRGVRLPLWTLRGFLLKPRARNSHSRTMCPTPSDIGMLF